MNSEVLIALFSKMIDERLESLPVPGVGPRGLRGLRGLDGTNGKSFDFAEHEEQIKAWAKDFALKFQDLSPEEVESLRGPRGADGRDGKDFNFEECSDTVRAWIQETALKFEDLDADQIESLRGPRGRDGKDGVNGLDFIWADHQDLIVATILEQVQGISESLKLNFSDLSEDDIAQLRGPRGRDGRDGKDFDFEEHRGFFESLKLKFEDLSEDERNSLKLTFSQLSDDERATLKLKFEDLTDEEKATLRGPRGVRGQRGQSGKDGVDGKQGLSVRGLPGPIGMRGLAGRSGVDGVDGRDGLDAPHVTDVEVEEAKDGFYLNFKFSDGSHIETKKISAPVGNTYFVSTSGIGNSGGSGNGNGDSAYDIAVANGFVGTEVQWLASLVGADGADGVDGVDGVDGTNGTNGADGADGLSAYDVAVANGFVGTEAQWLASLKGADGTAGSTTLTFACLSSVYVGAAVCLKKINVVETPMSDWTSMRIVVSLEVQDYDAEAHNAIAWNAPDSTVVGVVTAKPTTTTCEVTISGPVPNDLYLGLDVTKQYFLSDVVAGMIVPEEDKPTAPGSYVVKIGQAITNKKLTIDRASLIAL